MGAWGYRVSQDDVSADVYADFMERFNLGESKARIIARLKKRYASSLKDSDDGPVVWLALAKALWDCGWPDKPTFARVERIVKRGEGLERWAEEGERKLAKRRAALEEFVRCLREPNPKPKKPKRPIQRKAVFRKGDCVSIRLEDGRYAAAIVLDEEETSPSRTTETYGHNLIGQLDWIGLSPPDQAVFESRRWLRPTHHAWTGDRRVVNVSKSRFSEVADRFSVVGQTRIRSTDPRESPSYVGWHFAEQVVYQERWDKGVRD